MKRQRLEKRQRFFRKIWQLFCLVSLMAAFLFALSLFGMWAQYYGEMENPVVWLPLVIFLTIMAWGLIGLYKTTTALFDFIFRRGKTWSR